MSIRLRAVAAVGAVALGVGGCAATASTTASGNGGNLTIYVSATPPSASPAAQDVLAAEQLAFDQGGGQAGKYKLKLVKLTSSPITNNARKAIEDTSTIAYFGELAQGVSKDTVGITNDLDVLQVTPTDTALELTQASPVVSSSPSRYYEGWSTYGHTLGRVVPSSALEAKAQVQEMGSLHVKRLYVADDGSEYGRAMAQAVKTDAPSTISVVSTPAGADAMFYGAKSDSAAARAFASAAQANPAVKLFGPSALDDAAFVSMLSTAPRNLYISSAGFTRASLLPLAKKEFTAPFEAAYGHAPAPQAIFGYEAMSALIAVLKEAGSSANDRSTIVRDFLSIKNRSSVLGTYSINGSGDTNLGPFVFSRLESAKLVPFKFLQVQG